VSGRDIYLVGSVPMKNAEEVFQEISAALGSRVERIPDGETGERRDWIWLEPAFDQNPASRKSGEFFRVHENGTGRERYALKPGRRPQAARFENPFYADVAKEYYAAFKRLKDDGKIAGPGRPGSSSLGYLTLPRRCAARDDRSDLQHLDQA
jgi:hypothetical protein